ncbi:MAG: hypothetical protein RBU25_12740 [Lentisphaeria bacterium]|nr:hypothetical protein [Lentisphaeria bacterium]
MLFAMIAFIAVVGVTLPTSHRPGTKVLVIAMAAVLVTTACLAENIAPNSPWSKILSGLTMILAAFAWAKKIEQDKKPELLVNSKCPFCGQEFTYHKDDAGKTRSCSSCSNIFPNTDDQDYLAKYAQNTRELMAAVEDDASEETEPQVDDNDQLPTTNHPIFGGHIGVKDDS